MALRVRSCSCRVSLRRSRSLAGLVRGAAESVRRQQRRTAIVSPSPPSGQTTSRACRASSRTARALAEARRMRSSESCRTAPRRMARLRWAAHLPRVLRGDHRHRRAPSPQARASSRQPRWLQREVRDDEHLRDAPAAGVTASGGRCTHGIGQPRSERRQSAIARLKSSTCGRIASSSRGA